MNSDSSYLGNYLFIYQHSKEQLTTFYTQPTAKNMNSDSSYLGNYLFIYQHSNYFFIHFFHFVHYILQPASRVSPTALRGLSEGASAALLRGTSAEASQGTS